MNKIIGKRIILICCILSGFQQAMAQADSSATPADTAAKKVSGFDKFNKKMEHLFKIIPVPIITYSTEAGNTFGLAKFNLIQLSKKDTISRDSKISEVVTFSTKGRINASVTTELIFNQNRNIVLAYINYKKQPESIFGIGNDVTRDGLEEVQFERLKFFATGLQLVKKNLFVGIPIDVSSYFNIQPDSNSFLTRDSVTGVEGGFSSGTGFAIAYDTRENRYNPQQGFYAMTIFVFHPEFLGSYQYTHFELDVRKYYNPWLKHIVALQATTTANTGNTPFYELSQMGGDKQMRGYYQGAYRDKILVDGQVEYRAPIWNIFGAVAWIGTGRVASSYGDMSFDGFKLSYGGGIRIRVDSKNNTNLRLDFGFGPGGIQGAYFNFAEVF